MGDWYNKSQKVKVIGEKSVENIWVANMTYLQRIEVVLNSVGIFGSIMYKFKYPKILSEKDRNIILHPFSRSSERALTFSLIKQLISILSEKFNVDIYLLGTQNEFESRYVRLQENNKVKLAYVNKIEDLIQLIINSFLFIGVDSFPLHLADAYDTNFIGLFGPTDPKSVLVNYHNAITFSTLELNKLSFEELFARINKTLLQKLA